MRVIKLQATNVKRIKAIEIIPNAHFQLIGGLNSNGKTSALDSISLALAGKEASKLIKKVIREGQDSASATVTLGDEGKASYIVTRTWSKDGDSTLKITTPDGAKFGAPQEFLNEKLGPLGFDPLAFTRMSPAEQFTTLMGIVDIGVNLEALDIKAENVYSERTEIGREVKSLKAQLDATPLDESAPVQIVNVADLVNRYESATRTKNRQEAVVSEIARLKESLADKERELEDMDDFEDTVALKEQIDSAEETNNKIRVNQLHDSLVAKLETAEAEQTSKSLILDEIAKTKKDALENAVFPIPGLSVEGKSVTYNGIPFEQVAESEKILVAIAIGSAINPELRIMRISDGSLLDEASLAAIEKIAEEKDLQIFIEVVGDRQENAIIIENGEVKK